MTNDSMEFTHTGGGAVVNGGVNTQGGDFVGRDMIIQHYQEEWLIEENLEDIQATSFVAPSKIQPLLQRAQNQHLLVIYGANRMGKAGLSKYIASRIESDQQHLNTYRLRRRSDIQDLVDSLVLREHTIILVYDADPLEVEDILPTLHEMVLNTNNYVILTIDELPENLNVPIEQKHCLMQIKWGFPYTEQDLHQLLLNQLGDLLPLIENQGFSSQGLVKKLGSPSQIVRFVNMLRVLPERPNSEELQEMIEALQYVRREINSWLRNLDKDECYLALTLALLDDLPEEQFWTYYEKMVQIWRNRDHTLLALDYYALESFHNFVSLGSRIAFREVDYRYAVLGAQLSQYRRSLVAILPLFEEAPLLDDGSDRAMRIAIAQATGMIGTVEWAAVNKILITWAKHSSARVRASTSHAFREILDFSGPNSLQNILAELDRWITIYTPENREEDSPEKHNVRWTVASSLGRISRVVSRQNFTKEILPRLNKLSWDENYRVRKSIVYALRSLILIRFSDIQDILNNRAADWHHEVRWEVATILCKLAATRPSEVNTILISWLQEEGKERHWTSLWTILRLEDVSDYLLEKLYEFAKEDQDLRSHLYALIFNILAKEENNQQDTSMLEVLIREKTPGESFLLIRPMIQALDYGFPNANWLINTWQSEPKQKLQYASQVILEKLTAIQEERKQKWQALLKHCLNRDNELEAFAQTLPPHEQEAFWNDVHAKREEMEIELARKRKEEEKAKTRKKRIFLIIAVVIFLILCCISPRLFFLMLQLLYE